jgi:transcriptional regulator with XRE-family HTH domain
MAGKAFTIVLTCDKSKLHQKKDGSKLMTISTAQIRGARGLLNWGQSDLSERTGISTTSIGSIENGISVPRESSLTAIRKAFEDAGIEFLPNDGLRKRTGEVRVLKGRSGFWEFYQDVHNTLSNISGEVIVSNVDERKFEKWLGTDNLRAHTEKMESLTGISYRILVKEGDNYYLASPQYSRYRWMPKNLFASVPFYVYGEKLAILIFDDEPTVIILEYPSVAKAYRSQFEAIWSVSTSPDETDTNLKA